MIDYAKIRLKGRRYKHYRAQLRTHPALQWRPPIHHLDHPPQHCIAVADWGAWVFYADHNEVLEFRGSFHKSFHGGTNWQDFTQAQYCEEIQRITDHFNFPPEAMYFLNLEVGVNLRLPIPTKAVIESIMLHRRKRPVPMSEGHGIIIRHLGHYLFKVYDKALQYGLPYELVRFEIHVDRMEPIKRLKIHNAADLLDVQKWLLLEKFLQKKLKALLIVEPYHTASLRKQQIELLDSTRTVESWLGMNDKQRCKKRQKVERLLRTHGKYDVRGRLENGIRLKVHELIITRGEGSTLCAGIPVSIITPSLPHSVGNRLTPVKLYNKGITKVELSKRVEKTRWKPDDRPVLSRQ